MLAMQYSFTLPADYDMEIIHRRIASKGHLLDGFPGLAFKAYLSAQRNDRALPSEENLYAPFYLWHDNEAMNAFLAGAGFAALTQAFGWPRVRVWSVRQARTRPALADAVCATRDIVRLPAHTALGERLLREDEGADAAFAAGALAVVSAFEPTTWTLLRLCLWPQWRDDLARDGRQLYRAGHVSTSMPR
jgi:hypothetical protein